MTAGAILVPSIIPLRSPMVGQMKNIIDTETLIEMRSGMLRLKWIDSIIKIIHRFPSILCFVLKLLEKNMFFANISIKIFYNMQSLLTL